MHTEKTLKRNKTFHSGIDITTFSQFSAGCVGTGLLFQRSEEAETGDHTTKDSLGYTARHLPPNPKTNPPFPSFLIPLKEASKTVQSALLLKPKSLGESQ